MFGSSRPLNDQWSAWRRRPEGVSVGGTVVEALTEETVEVEFSDEEGRAYAFAAVPIEKLIVLHYRPEVECA